MAVRPETQERLSVFSHSAATSCTIADGPKRHQNSYPQQNDVAEMLGGLAISKRLLTGLRLMLLFLDFPEETRKLLGPGTLAEGAFTGTYSTRPSSTTFEILTPDRDVESSDDGLIPPTAYHCSCESFNILRRSRTSPIQPQMSATT